MYLTSSTNALNYGSHPPPDSVPGIFKNDSSTLLDREFFLNSAYIFRESDQIFMKISSQMYP